MMNQELGIPREYFDWPCDNRKSPNFNISENLGSYKNDNWAIISGFPRHLISLIRPRLESEIGPIDNWINEYTKEGLDIYFVCFRNHKILQKSLQFDKTSISGYIINIYPCFEDIYMKIKNSAKELFLREELHSNSNIKVKIV